MSYTLGEILLLSPYWQTEAKLDQDYASAWFLIYVATKTVKAQDMNAQPGGGFAPTSRWQVGIPVWDNRALPLWIYLPDNIACG